MKFSQITDFQPLLLHHWGYLLCAIDAIWEPFYNAAEDSIRKEAYNKIRDAQGRCDGVQKQKWLPLVTTALDAGCPVCFFLECRICDKVTN